MATAPWVVKGRTLSCESFGQLRDPVLNGQSLLPRGTIVVGFFSRIVFCSLRINSDMLVARALKNRQLPDGESHVIYGTGR